MNEVELRVEALKAAFEITRMIKENGAVMPPTTVVDLLHAAEIVKDWYLHGPLAIRALETKGP